MKPVVLIMDLAKGYGDSASWGHDLIARVRRLKDAAHTAGVPVIHVHSMRRPMDNLPERTSMLVGTEALEVLPELQPTEQDIIIYKRYLNDCTMGHRPTEPPEVYEYALRIIRNPLHSEVFTLDEVVARYLPSGS